ncbi:MAG: class I SAM-dependent methyltransferase [Candidatus Aenigmarchaeota archaeon]|nr:class I SAM-dependent methyltransferase [Candidatus Aenigmarchaeota archaeon]
MGARKAYNKMSPGYNDRHSTATVGRMRAREMRLIREFINQKDNPLVLDVGCGTGYHLHFAGSMIGIDISEGMLEKAAGSGKPVVQAAAEALPLKDESIGHALCFFAVLNMCDFHKAIRELNRVLKWKGLVLLSVASAWDRGYRFRHKLVTEHRPHDEELGIGGERLRMHLFTRKELEDAFKGNGFKVEHFGSSFVFQKPEWKSVGGFRPGEAVKLLLEKIVPGTKHYGSVYFAVFRKVF